MSTYVNLSTEVLHANASSTCMTNCLMLSCCCAAASVKFGFVCLDFKFLNMCSLDTIDQVLPCGGPLGLLCLHGSRFLAWQPILAADTSPWQ